ncbi:MAG: 3-phosphoshikimate 1-carboxyvinyltransferase [Ruminiclostridium sp.]|nr:3-phosphoshikimate 1-carboxyvinyltransferase [Ruminiclostridium sp.]
MTVTIQPGAISGTIRAIPSKSAAHRLLICAALADKPTHVFCEKESQDIAATVRCLQGLGASIWQEGGAYRVVPIHRERIPQSCTLDCGESGSTLRFMVPVVCALGVTATFQMAGRLAQRPMEPLATQLREHGCTITHKPDQDRMEVSGHLRPGTFTIPGNVSSQFITGLLFALPLLDGESTLVVEGELESKGYVDMTLSALQTFGITPPKTDDRWMVSPSTYASPGTLQVEGDWSNAAPWLCMGILGGQGITVEGMDPQSLQGDKGVCEVLARMGGLISGQDNAISAKPGALAPTIIDARNIPDLVPVLAAAAATAPGETRVEGAARLRIKESDRLMTTRQTLNALGGDVEETEDGLIIRGKPQLSGGTVDAQGDHRIAMLAAVASVVCTGPVTITGAEAIRKSYPTFWQELRDLGKEVAEEP